MVQALRYFFSVWMNDLPLGLAGEPGKATNGKLIKKFVDD
jgi:hypothetical protein